MPTGYTAAVQDGTITDFPTFAMQCARAFGALITMRDDPHDATIPEAFEPSTYSADRLIEATAELARLEAMSEEEIRAAAAKAFDDETASWEAWKKQRAEQRARYDAMLEKVIQWVPPTEDHNELKSFMSQQLRESIDFDCSRDRPEPVRASHHDWHVKAVIAAEREIAYHTEADKDERKRTAERNKWVAQLRASLAADAALSKARPVLTGGTE